MRKLNLFYPPIFPSFQPNKTLMYQSSLLTIFSPFFSNSLKKLNHKMSENVRKTNIEKYF